MGNKAVSRENTKDNALKYVLYGLALVAIVVGGFFGYNKFVKQDEAETVVRIALIPSEDTDTMYQRFDDWVKYIEDEVGVKVEIVEAEDYAAVITALKYGHADIARFGSFSYVLAKSESDIEPFLAPIKASTGSSYYYGYIVVRTDSGISAIEDLSGKKFGYVDLGSTSGYLYPKYTLMSAGVGLNDEDAIITGGHPQSILAVKNGSIDAAGIASNRYEQALKEGVIADGELTIIYQSDKIPTNAWAAREGFDSELLAKLKETMLNMPTELVMSTGLEESGYEDVDDSYFDIVRDIAKKLNLDLKELD